MTDSFLNFWSGARVFASELEIAEHIGSACSLSADDVAKARLLLIFDTSKQHTCLATIGGQLHCVLDDVRKDEPRLQWSMNLEDARNAVIETSSAKSKGHGLLRIGERRRWLYSKKLFASSGPIENAVKELLGQG